MPKGEEYATLLRVHAVKREIDPRVVRSVLGLSESDPLVSSVEFNEEKSMLMASFESGPALDHEDVERWQTADFRNVVLWLKSRSVSQFEQLAGLGLGIDIYVGGYWGKIPRELLVEIARLGIGLWFSY